MFTWHSMHMHMHAWQLVQCSARVRTRAGARTRHAWPHARMQLARAINIAIIGKFDESRRRRHCSASAVTVGVCMRSAVACICAIAGTSTSASGSAVPNWRPAFSFLVLALL